MVGKEAGVSLMFLCCVCNWRGAVGRGACILVLMSLCCVCKRSVYAGVCSCSYSCVVFAAMARPGEQEEDEDNFQDDEPEQGPASSPNPPVLRTTSLTLTPKPGDTVFLPCDVDNGKRLSLLSFKTRIPPNILKV